MAPFSFLAYYQGIPFDSPIIRFYAVAILLGAFLALFLANYHAHQDGFDWHFFDTIFLLAFPAGIIGARIWYVIATWPECSGMTTFFGIPGTSIWQAFAIWEGGLAIQGGAIGGVLAGAIFIHYRRRGTPILHVLDYAVPGVLIAQAIGRVGNFFNQEVFGHAVDPSAWSFLPAWITNNMSNGNKTMGITGVLLPAGSMAVPLFLVEAVINVLFYFLLQNGLRSVEGKHYVDGDISFSYFIAYGITRMILEPLRNPAFIMGEATANQAKSFTMAIAFICFGVLCILLNHVLRYLSQKGKLDKVPLVNRFLAKRGTAPAEVRIPKEKKEDSHDTEKKV
jgi:phosphatidylglycerol---prolipoprotein diacylglyceryl transferase